MGDCVQLCFSNPVSNCSYDLFTNDICDEECNNKYCIGYAAGRIDESLTASLVTPDVLSHAMSDCQDYIFNDELDKKISTMMADCNQVSSSCLSSY